MSSATTKTTSTESPEAALTSQLDATSTEPLPVNVMFFDGVCGLCNNFVTFVLSRDRRGTIRFAPLQGETAKRCGAVAAVKPATSAAASLPEAPTFDTFVWRDAAGRHSVRSAASVRVLWQLGGVWKLIGTLLWLIPLPLRDLGYRLVAANRFRLFGRKESCRLPTPAERSQFLD